MFGNCLAPLEIPEGLNLNNPGCLPAGRQEIRGKDVKLGSNPGGVECRPSGFTFNPSGVAAHLHRSPGFPAYRQAGIRGYSNSIPPGFRGVLNSYNF